MKWNTPTETGWFVNLAEGGSAVSIFDPSGNVQGELIPASDDGSESVAGGRKRKSSTAEQDRSRLTFRKGRPASLRLSDGTIGTLIDQKPKAMRRKNKLCEVDIAGRTYLFVHSSAERQQPGVTESHWHTWNVADGPLEAPSPEEPSRQRTPLTNVS